METKNVLQNFLQKGIYGGLALLVCMVSIMGYYPLVPSYYAVYCLKKKRTWLVYLGLLIGIVYEMSFKNAVKYIFILILLYLVIQFYIWANRKCSGWVAGIIGAVVTIVMNCSGSSLARMDRTELLLGIMEGFMVMGLTALFHYAEEMAGYLLENITGMNRRMRYTRQSDGVSSQADTKITDTKITAFVSAVNGLSEAFLGMGKVRERSLLDYTASLEREITGHLCADCEGCAICWENNSAFLANGIRRMLYEVVAHRPKEEILEQELVDGCLHYKGMVEAAMDAFGRMELNEAWYRRLVENRQVIAHQLDAMADLLQEWTKGCRNVDRTNWLLLGKIAFEAKEKGLVAQRIHLYEDENGRLSVQASVEGKWGGGIPVSQYVQAVGNALNRPMRVEKDAKSILTRESAEIMLYEDTVFYTLPGIATWKKNGSSVSGDNFIMFDMDDGRYHICLSDGMGSGSEACRESECVVDLLQKFIEAGFSRETSIRMMNSAMVLQGENNSYSTLDYASIDMYTGELEMIKIGAAASFLKRKDYVECFFSDSLPAGVHMEQEMFVQQKQLESGDFLVMVTDGVLEYLHAQNQEEYFCRMLKETGTGHTGMMAQDILDKVLQITGGYAADDMTILVIGFWRK